METGLLKNRIRLFFPKAKFLLGVLLKVKFLRGLLFYSRSAYTFFEAYSSFRPRIVHFFLPGAYIQGGLTSLLIPGVYRIMSRRALMFIKIKNQCSKSWRFFTYQNESNHWEFEKSLRTKCGGWIQTN